MTVRIRHRSTRPTRLMVLAVVLMLSALTAACGKPAGVIDVSGPAKAACDAPRPAKPTTVEVLAYSAPALDPFTDAMVEGCGDVPDLEIKHLPVDFGGQLQKGELSLSAQEGSYDLIQAYNGSISQYASKGWLVPLDKYIKKYQKKYKLDDIDSTAWDGFRYRGKIYGIPNQTNTPIMIYRKDIFADLGLKPPKTYADMMEAAQKMKAAGSVKYPMSMVWGADDALANGFHMWLTSNGGRWFDKSGRPDFDSPAGRRAVRQMQKMLPYMPSASMTFGNGDVMALMQQKLVGMTTIWASRADPITDERQSRVADKVGFAPAPASAEGGTPASEVSQDGFIIPRNSKLDPEYVFRLMASTTTAPGVMEKAATAAIPSRASVVENKKVQRPYWPAARSTTEGGAQALPAVPYMELAKSVINPYLAKALSGKTSGAAALRGASRELEKTLRSKGYLS